jgi:diguanylate cyclase (GGDEF)-like protein
MVGGGRDSHSWLCPDDARRERAVDMERRLKPVRTVAMASLTLELLATGHWIGWWPVLTCIVVAVGFALADLRLDGFRRPEIAIATMWVVTQFAIAVAVWLTGAANAPTVAWLVIPVVTLPARFDLRVVIAGVVFTALLMLGVTILPDPSVLSDAPQLVLAPLALLVAVACLSSALMLSDIHHRTESVIDGLTGMLNRRALGTRLAELAGQAEVTGEPIGVIIGDLDHFKRINDEHGHTTGDAVLVDVAYTLRKELRAFDLAYRLGGEEFLVVLPGASLAESAEVAERLRASVASVPAGGVRVTMSFGVASSGGGAFEHDVLLRAADEALYEAKRGGRNRVAAAGGPLRPVLAA